MTPKPRTQRFIVDLPTALARKARAIVHEQGSYADLNELILVALENQLQLHASPLYEEEVTQHRHAKTSETGMVSATSDLKTPAGRNAEIEKGPYLKESGRLSPIGKTAGRRLQQSMKTTFELMAKPSTRESKFDVIDDEALLRIPVLSEWQAPKAASGKGYLSAFTNRLTPFVIPTRVLANAMMFAAPPSIDEFLQRTPIIARSVGIWLKEEDLQLGRRGRLRHSTAWPAGDDHKASINRFRRSFLFGTDSSGTAGPLLELGLATIQDGHVVPTDRAVEFASERTPLLGELEDKVLLSTRQQELLRTALSEMEEERRHIKEFLKAIQEAEGAQGTVDRLIASARPRWTEAQVVSHRAAMVGRLRDVGVIDLSPALPGKEVQILLSEPLASEFERALGPRR